VDDVFDASDIDANAAAATFSYAPTSDARPSNDSPVAFRMERTGLDASGSISLDLEEDDSIAESAEPLASLRASSAAAADSNGRRISSGAGSINAPPSERLRPPKHYQSRKGRSQTRSKRKGGQSRSRSVKRNGRQQAVPRIGVGGYGQRAVGARFGADGGLSIGIRPGSVREVGGSMALIERFGSTYASSIAARAMGPAAFSGGGGVPLRPKPGMGRKRRDGGSNRFPPLR